jgi:hypothetical protein
MPPLAIKPKPPKPPSIEVAKSIWRRIKKPSADTLARIKKLSSHLDQVIQFDIYRVIGAAGRKGLPLVLVPENKALIKGIGYGLALGALTRRKKKKKEDELSSKRDVVEFAFPSLKTVIKNPSVRAGIGLGGTVAGAGLLGVGIEHVRNQAKRQKEWRENAKPNDVLKIAKGLYIDRAGAMYPEEHPAVKTGRVTQLSAMLDHLINFAADTRPRNDVGQFTQQEGGPDPNAMYRTYRQPAPRQPGLVDTAATAAVGGTIGTAATLGTKGLWNALKKIKLGKK